MSDKEFRVLLDLFMCADPWPLTEEAHETVQTMLNLESIRRGYEGWIEAFHIFGNPNYVPTPGAPK